jgi:hypothetical protein
MSGLLEGSRDPLSPIRSRRPVTPARGTERNGLTVVSFADRRVDVFMAELRREGSSRVRPSNG